MKTFRIFKASEAKNGFHKLLNMADEADTIVVVVNSASKTYYQLAPLSDEYRRTVAGSEGNGRGTLTCSQCGKRVQTIRGLSIHVARRHQHQAHDAST